MLTIHRYLDDLLSGRPRFRLNLSSYAAPSAVPLRWALIGFASLLALGIAWDLLDLWNLRTEIDDLARSTTRLREQDRRTVAEAGREGWDLSETTSTRLPSEIAFVNRLIEKRQFSWTHFLSELEQTVPVGVGVGSIRLDPNSAVIQMTGTARTFEDLTAFLTLLQDDPEFDDPVLKQHQDREDGLVEFHVTMHYRTHGTRG